MNAKKAVENDKTTTRMRGAMKTLERKYHEAMKQAEAHAKETEAALKLRKHVKTFSISPTTPTDTSEATAVWLASDWHVGERVTMGQTNGINEYTPEIAKTRATRYFQRGLRLTQIFGRDIAINRVVLALLGD